MTIRQRTALLAEMRRALKPLADIPIEAFDSLEAFPDDYPLASWNTHTVTYGDIRRARRALEMEDRKA